MKKYLMILMSSMVFQASYSQDFETILLAAEDAGVLAKHFTEPYVKGLMYDLNNGWYTTAKTHKKFGFDLTINPSVTFLPKSAMYFTFNPGEYKYISLPNGETKIHSILSDSEENILINVSIPNDDGEIQTAQFYMPKGIGKDLPLSVVPFPMVQLGLGLPTSTDLKVRFIPNMKIGDNFSFNLYGLGLQHNITQYLKLDNPFFNLSVLAAYTSTKTAYTLDDDQDTGKVEVIDGEAVFKIDTWTVQALASMDFKLATLYGGLGYNNGRASFDVDGTYKLTYERNDGSFTTKTVTDPVHAVYEGNGFRGTAGARLNLGFFKIFADYTLQEFQTVSAGIAFSFR